MAGACVRSSIRVVAATVATVAGATSHADTASFRQGVDGYAGTQDAHIQNFNPGDNFGGETFLDVQDDGTFIRRSLLRFDEIIGGGPGQIPPHSRIVSATLTVEVVLAQPDVGATMHRLLSDWSESTLTWNNFGSGAGGQPDVDFDSAILASISMTTSGTRSFDVTDEVQDWVDGDPALGWLYQGTSGFVGRFRSSEGAADDRPLLEVEFTPVEAATVCLQQGVDGYTGTQDAHIQSFNPESNFGGEDFLDMQDDGTFIRRTLIRFDDLIGTGPGQVPPLSRIVSARLIMDVSLAQPTAGATLHRALVDWSESTVTWNGFGSGGGGQPDVDFAAEILGATMLVTAGSRTFDVTATVQAYADGHPAHGWLFQGISGLVGRFSSSEAATTRRPILKVAYLPCAVESCAADINDSGDVTFADLLLLLGAWGPCPAP